MADGYLGKTRVKYSPLPLEVEHLRFGRDVDEMGAAIKKHIRCKLCLVNLTGFRTGDSDADRNLLFDQI